MAQPPFVLSSECGFHLLLMTIENLNSFIANVCNKFASFIAMQSIGNPFTELEAVDSTNNYAMAAAKNGTAKWGEAWFAHRQTAGKGSRGKSWNTGAAENIALSVLLPHLPSLFFSESFLLTAAVALAAHDLFLQYAASDVSIKWPNDIYWRDRKAAGILIENSFRGSEWQFSVAGIGMNINQTAFDSAIGNPVSLKQITGKAYDTVTLAKELCECLQARYNQLQQDKNSVLEDYNNALYKRGEEATLKKGNIVFRGTIKQVGKDGLLEVDNDIQRQFTFGDIEWVLPERNSIQ